LIELCQNIVRFGFFETQTVKSLLLQWKPRSWFWANLETL